MMWLIDFIRYVMAYRSKSSEPKKEKIFLHDHDLSYWMYLGYTSFSFNGYSPAFVHFFASKKDFNKRSYTLLQSPVNKRLKIYNTHPWVMNVIPAWKAGEYSLLDVVKEPSNYIINRMFEEHSMVWDKTNKTWLKSEAAKYKNAVEKQKESVETEEHENVITLRFGKAIYET